MATIEERVARLESEVQELRHADVAAGLQAQAYGLSLVQGQVNDLRTETREGLTAVNGRLDGMDARLTGIESTLAQILERLDQR
jgi:predicted lipoprotein